MAYIQSPGIYMDINYSNVYRIHLYPPEPINFPSKTIDSQNPNAINLFRIGIDNIIEGIVDLLKLNRFDVGAEEIVKMNFNQYYLIMVNYTWLLKEFTGEILNNRLYGHIKGKLHSILSHLVSLETFPGDFGQNIDFRNCLSPHDFGLEEYER